MQQICAALACLRNQPPPIVHRAVTPHNIIGVTASRLRANLQKHDANHEYIVTVRGRGYQFVQMPRAKD